MFGVEGHSPSIDRFVNPFGFAGYQRENVGGMLYAQARYYDPRNGRFNAEDGARDGLNWYSYCDGNPVNRIDPRGLFYIVRDREPSSFFRQGEFTGTYSVVHSDYGLVLWNTMVGAVPFVGSVLNSRSANPLARRRGDIIGGTSAPTWNNTEIGLNIAVELATMPEIMQPIGNTATVFSSLMTFSHGNAIYNHDRVLFGMMDSIGLPTQFSSLEQLTTQMNILQRTINNNPGHFGTFDNHEYSRFLRNIRVSQGRLPLNISYSAAAHFRRQRETHQAAAKESLARITKMVLIEAAKVAICDE